jgi:hypothetical protein
MPSIKRTSIEACLPSSDGRGSDKGRLCDLRKHILDGQKANGDTCQKLLESVMCGSSSSLANKPRVFQSIVDVLLEGDHVSLLCFFFQYLLDNDSQDTMLRGAPLSILLRYLRGLVQRNPDVFDLIYAPMCRVLTLRCCSRHVQAELFQSVQHATMAIARRIKKDGKDAEEYDSSWIRMLASLPYTFETNHHRACFVSLVHVIVLDVPSSDFTTTIARALLHGLYKSAIQQQQPQQQPPSEQSIIHTLPLTVEEYRTALDAWWPAQDMTLHAPVLGSQFRCQLACRSDVSCFFEARQAIVSRLFDHKIWARPELAYFLHLQGGGIQEQLLQDVLYTPLEDFLQLVEPPTNFRRRKAEHNNDNDDDDDDTNSNTNAMNGEEEEMTRTKKSENTLRYLENLSFYKWVDTPNTGIMLCDSIAPSALIKFMLRIQGVLDLFAVGWANITYMDRLETDATVVSAFTRRSLPRAIRLCIELVLGVACRFAYIRNDERLRLLCESTLLQHKELVRHLVYQLPRVIKLIEQVTTFSSTPSFTSSFVYMLLGDTILSKHAFQLVHGSHSERMLDQESDLNPLLSIRVTRTAILPDTLTCLTPLPTSLLCNTLSLCHYRVEFAGEAGVGLGPVHEWLHLLTRELFDPIRSLWQYNTQQQGWELHTAITSSPATLTPPPPPPPSSPAHPLTTFHTTHDLIFLSGIVMALFMTHRIPFPYRLTHGTVYQLLFGWSDSVSGGKRETCAAFHALIRERPPQINNLDRSGC